MGIVAHVPNPEHTVAPGSGAVLGHRPQLLKRLERNLVVAVDEENVVAAGFGHTAHEGRAVPAILGVQHPHSGIRRGDLVQELAGPVARSVVDDNDLRAGHPIEHVLLHRGDRGPDAVRLVVGGHDDADRYRRHTHRDLRSGARAAAWQAATRSGSTKMWIVMRGRPAASSQMGSSAQRTLRGRPGTAQ